MNNLLFYTIKQIAQVLTKRQKLKGLGLLFLIVFSGLLDVLGLAAILPVIFMAAEPEIIVENKYLSAVYDYFNFNNINSFLLAAALAVFFIFLLKNLFSIFTIYTQSKYSFAIAENLARKQFKAFYEMPYLELKEYNSNRIINNIAFVSTEFSSMILNQTFILLSEVFVILLIIVGIAIIDIKLLLLLSILLVPITLLFYRSIRKTISKLGDEKNERRIQMQKTLYQSFHGYTDIKINNKGSYFGRRFFNEQYLYFNALIKQFLISQLPTKVIEMAALSGIVIIFLYALYFNNDTAQLIAFLTLFATAAYRLMPSLNRILISVINIRTSFYVFDIMKDVKKRIQDIKLEDTEIAEEAEEARLNFQNEIIIKDLSFTYKEEDDFAIENINLIIKKGESVGFIGTSGSGKTTLFNILLRLIKEDKGQILVDGIPVTEEMEDSWRKTIGYVRQDYYLTDDTFAENIALGEHLKDIDKEKLNKAVKAASLEPLVNQLKDGVYAKVGEHGGNLSGGQRQRIAIARALYKDAQILLFDEATSALDNETEREIIDTINQISIDKTILMIAHRITTLKSCDRIYEMKQGRINRVLTYKELIDSEIEVS